MNQKVKGNMRKCQEALKLHQAGNFVDAEILYNKILETEPANIDTIFFLGTLKLQQGDTGTARALLENTIILKPDHAAAYNNLGTVFKEQNKFEEAIKNYNKSLALKPDYAMAHNNLGNLLKDIGKFAEAETSCRRAILLQPDFSDAHNNLASTLQKQGKHEEAIRSYNLAVKYNPKSVHAHINRSSALLLTENLEDGWPEYEWRLQTKNYNSSKFQLPHWDGSPLNGKTIFVHAEQGYGDTIQFVRYLPMVKDLGGHVIFECQKELIRLLKNCAGIDEIVEMMPSQDIVFDTHIHLLSLPGIFGTNMDSIPSCTPYITVDPVLSEKWRLQLSNNNNLKIGIVWAGRSTFKDHYRSCTFDDFISLSEIPGITFYSLQKGPSSEEALNAPEDMKVINLDKELNDFDDTAAVMNNLDLIISTDTAVAHLAGAIGKPVWTLLHTSSDWRWFLNRECSPWYPEMRLFRQSVFSDWRGVFDKVKTSLISIFGPQIGIYGENKTTNSEIQNLRLSDLLQEAHRHHQAGDFTSAIMCYNIAIKKHPDNALTHFHLGSALHGTGRIDDALASYRKAKELKPDYSDAYYSLGNTYREQGKIKEAVVNYLQAVSLKPDNAEIHCNLGAALQESGRPDEAIVSYKKAITLNPYYAMAHCNLGSLLHESGKLNDAAASYKRSTEINPDLALAHNNLGTAFKDLGRLDESVESYRKAIALKPDYAEAHNNLGTALLEQHKLQEAVISYNRALEIRPKYAEAYNNLGTILQELCQLDQAVENYRKAIALKPNFAEAYNNLGTALQDSGKHGEALAYYKQATILKPDFALAHVNRSFVLLLTENFKEGWKEYKWRLNIKNRASTTRNHHMWNGGPLNGKSILVHAEQGFGDTIQFVRYLPMVKEQGGHVVLACHKSLHRLFKNYNGIDEIIEKSSVNTLPEQPDVHIHLLDLPGLFETTLKSIPLKTPYITPDQILVDQWASWFKTRKDFKIGLVWAGNPHHSKDHNRSCSLSDFNKLTDVPEWSFYSLQKVNYPIDSKDTPIGMNIVNIGKGLNDFADTAAVIANLDLVITVDTAVAHLAGAIGKPVWTLLPFAPDWRWLLKRNDSPWYPTMRLFRQNQPGNWTEVFEQVKEELTNNFCLQVTEVNE
ncbi:hypothetical protein SCALIN_C05_0096 [Candidatus Scalindua japonica]|uniref:Uncharacterized protein n=1 Tax=Candidatus Scalindua japonica TaxID=1284222 RepID=A0A286TW14_9BACT|nr:tetratricopeptide repeat protein [Candidatus Scalindua japonica]GAX60011.1 hypothetical protein SCALIN_C05_0096 [Candidatus Scalindua japonica]